MQISAEGLSTLDWLIHGGNIGALICAAWVGWKVNGRMAREESMKANFPPHRHVNGKVLYPEEYQPTPIERLSD